MNQREKILGGAVGGLVAIFVIGFGVRAAILKPLKDIDNRIKASKEKVEKIANEKRQFFATEDRMKQVALRTYGETTDQASAASGEILTKRILESGLEESEFTRTPASPRKLKGALEIGWMIQGEGPLTNIINLLFLLENSPYVHRVENLTVTTGEAVGRVKTRFRFLTLVLDPSPEVQRKALPDKFALDSAERHAYDDLIARDILRPYIKRPPPPPKPATSPGNNGGTPPPIAPGPESYKIVSLSEWEGQPEVAVLEPMAQKTRRYRVGDSLAGGTIICIDYREMPMPDSFALSESRVILKIGNEFWAIERGKTLADKHKLEPQQLPREVAKLVQ
jgi:hypothetical protein